jgi:Kef-type K+ transport system membrane component KefB/mannitol/fructose-specific phosphotransferase system IIA component (Ntr-type)
VSGFDALSFLLALGLLLLVGRVLGELALKLKQPPVLGEIVAGILLGPTVLGRLAPGAFHDLFPTSGANAVALNGLATFVVTLFMLVAGMEVELSTIWRRGRAAFAVSLSGIVIPFALGLGTALLWPDALGREAGANNTVFVLFFAIALAISALPVIARTLLDLNLYRSDMGMVVIASAIFDDLVGWIVFAVVLGLMEGGEGHAVGPVIAMVLAYAVLMLTAGRWLIDRSLPWIQAHLSWPAGVLGFTLTLAMFGAALTEWIGVHAVIGAFMVGVALGDSRHLREHTRTTIEQFVSHAFAPLFFAGIGLTLDFAAHFDLALVAVVLVIACAGKILGCGLGARAAGLPRREAWAVGFGMNARGAMEIILGLLALQAGLIDERLFVALVIMALVTTIMSGPIMRALLARPRRWRLADLLVPRASLLPLRATDARGALAELCAALAAEAHLPADALERAVLAAEGRTPSGLGHGVALPHAAVPGLARPLAALGRSAAGIDCDAPDGQPAHLLVLVLTPADDDGAQADARAGVARLVEDAALRQHLLAAASFTEVLAALRIDDARAGTPQAEAAPAPRAG